MEERTAWYDASFNLRRERRYGKGRRGSGRGKEWERDRKKKEGGNEYEFTPTSTPAH